MEDHDPRRRGFKAIRLGWTPTSEDQFIFCEECRQWFDLRELEQVLYHMKDGHSTPRLVSDAKP